MMKIKRFSCVSLGDYFLEERVFKASRKNHNRGEDFKPNSGIPNPHGQKQETDRQRRRREQGISTKLSDQVPQQFQPEQPREVPLPPKPTNIKTPTLLQAPSKQSNPRSETSGSKVVNNPAPQQEATNPSSKKSNSIIPAPVKDGPATDADWNFGSTQGNTGNGRASTSRGRGNSQQSTRTTSIMAPQITTQGNANSGGGRFKLGRKAKVGIGLGLLGLGAYGLHRLIHRQKHDFEDYDY